MNQQTKRCLYLISLLLLSFTVYGKTLSHDVNQDIHWIYNDVTKGLAQSKQQQKPIFLYWGAVWCPPCNQIKATVFTDKNFINKSRLFIPVYLDGDSESAQQWGDHFNISGYPTLLILNQQGEEITRIAGGIDIDAFNSILDVALESLKPVKQIVADALSGKKLTNDEYKIIAYYSWHQDNNKIFQNEEKSQQLQQLYKLTPTTLTVERSRLFMAYLLTAITDLDEINVAQLSSKQIDINLAYQQFTAILSTPTLLNANVVEIIYYADDIIKGLTTHQSKERLTLLSAVINSMEMVWKNEKYTTDDRLAAILPQILLTQLETDQPQFSDALINTVKQRIQWAKTHAKNSWEYYVVINTSAYLLRKINLGNEAIQLLSQELENTKTPYYLLSTLARVADKTGDIEQSLSWLERAWQQSTGRSTRLQWGATYLKSLLSNTPNNNTAIKQTALLVLQEAQQLNDMFNGRNKRIIDSLNKNFTEWATLNEKNKETVVEIRQQLSPYCETLAKKPDSYKHCLSFTANT